MAKMESLLTEFYTKLAAALSVTPQEAAKYVYWAVGIMIVVLLLVFIFKKMKALLWVAIGIGIVFFAFFGGGKNLGEWVEMQIDADYCTQNPATFWCGQ